MLAVSFFVLVFSSLMWFIFSVRHVMDSLKGVAFFDAGTVSIISYVIIVCLPIFLMWLIFSFVSQYLHNKYINAAMIKLSSQMKRGQEYSDLLSRIMIETEQQIKDGFMLSKFDLLLADMNELLAEIIRYCNLASNEQIEHLWHKVQNGGKWSFGKVIVEINSAQPNFQQRIYGKAQKDIVLAGTIMEFCARYQSTVSLLEKHDREKVFLNIIEAGIMGKVFSILAPVADEIRRIRETNSIFKDNEDTPPQFNKTINKQVNANLRAPASPQSFSSEEEQKESFIEKFSFFKKKHLKPAENNVDEKGKKDPFSLALEKSFGNAEETEYNTPEDYSENNTEEENSFWDNTPKFDISLPDEDENASPEIFTNSQDKTNDANFFSDTQKSLDNLKKEWATLSKPETTTSLSEKEDISVEDEDTELNTAYPFGGWTDEKNYK